MSKFDDRLKDYIDVKARIALFYAAHPDGRLVTLNVQATREPDDVPRIWVEAAAYRTADDPLPGRGWSWITLPGSTPYTRGSEIENAETSAWGRAIGSLGIGIENSIASADEVRAKETIPAKAEQGDDGSLIGTAEAGTQATSDFLLRQTPTGSALGFRLRGEKGGYLVVCKGRLAEQMATHRDAAIGKRVFVWGRVHDVDVPSTDKKRGYSYAAIAADRVRVPDVGDLPMDATPEPDAALGGSSEPTEAESVPLFSDAEQAEIDAALLGAEAPSIALFDELERIGA